nr:hypothetical protein [Bacteroides sp. AM54-2NS]
MKLREALDTYMFDNVGQFGGIAESLGYQTEYRDGYFRFRKDGEELSMSVSEIREKAGAKYDESLVTNQKNVYPPFLTRNVPMILNMSPSWRRMASASSGGRT